MLTQKNSTSYKKYTASGAEGQIHNQLRKQHTSKGDNTHKIIKETMGIKQLFSIIRENAPDAIKEGEIKNHFGRKVAIDAYGTPI